MNKPYTLTEAIANQGGTGIEWPDFFKPLKAPEVLGEPLSEAEKLLKDIDNSSIDLKIEGVREAIKTLQLLEGLGPVHISYPVRLLKTLIEQMEGQKAL